MRRALTLSLLLACAPALAQSSIYNGGNPSLPASKVDGPPPPGVPANQKVTATEFNNLVTNVTMSIQGLLGQVANWFPFLKAVLPTPPASFTAQVRVAFIGPAHPLALAGVGAGDTAAVALPAHGTAVVRIPAFTSLTPGPEWRDLVRLRVMGKAGDWASVVRTISLSRP